MEGGGVGGGGGGKKIGLRVMASDQGKGAGRDELCSGCGGGGVFWGVNG